jgi:NADH-quinone oxidoreductase subunit N
MNRVSTGQNKLREKFMTQLPNFICIIPEIAVLIGICVLMGFDVLVKQKNHLCTFVLAEIVVIIAAILTSLQFSEPTIISFSGHFIRDDFSSVLKLFIYLMVFVSFYFAYPYLTERKVHQGEYYILGLFSLLGMMILVSAHNLVTLYLGLELLSLPLYAMMALYRHSHLGVESTIKYFVMGAFASGILLYGMSMIYGASGSLDIGIIAQQTLNTNSFSIGTYTFGIIFLILGIAFKFG